MGTKPKGDSVKVDLPITPASFHAALERMADAAGGLPDVTLQLGRLTDQGEVQFLSGDGAFELTLYPNGHWQTVFHTVVTARSL